MAKGSIYKRVAKDGTVSWWVMADIAPDAVTGKRRQRKRTYRTKREAEAGLTTWLADLERGTAVDPSNMNVGAYLRHWLETSVRPRVRPSTYSGYERLIRVLLVPRLGTVPLQRLNALQIQQAYTDMLSTKCGNKKAGMLSNRSVRAAHTVLKMALKQAVRWRLVAHNTAEDVDPPKAVRPQIQAWDAREAQLFLAAVEGDPYSPFWLLALSTGMRLGELRGLRWCDVDLAHGVLRVQQQITRVDGKDLTSEPKTKAGRRTITLPIEAVSALREHQQRRTRRPVPLDPAQRDIDPVFATSLGAPWSQDTLVSHFKRLIARACSTRITIHGLRHTHATLLLAAGVNIKAVSERLGHSSIQITLDTYAHVLPQMEQHAADAIGQLLARQA